jgi:hypothetical protein
VIAYEKRDRDGEDGEEGKGVEGDREVKTNGAKS